MANDAQNDIGTWSFSIKFKCQMDNLHPYHDLLLF